MQKLVDNLFYWELIATFSLQTHFLVCDSGLPRIETSKFYPFDYGAKVWPVPETQNSTCTEFNAAINEENLFQLLFAYITLSASEVAERYQH